MSWPHGAAQTGFGFPGSISPSQTNGEGQGNKATRGFPLYISNIPLDINEEELRQMFGQAGEVISSRCLPPKEGKNSCVGFITYNTEEEANKAISVFHNQEISGQNLRVDYTKSFKENRGNTRSSSSSQVKNVSSFPAMDSVGKQNSSLNFKQSSPSGIGRGIHSGADVDTPYNALGPQSNTTMVNGGGNKGSYDRASPAEIHSQYTQPEAYRQNDSSFNPQNDVQPRSSDASPYASYNNQNVSTQLNLQSHSPSVPAATTGVLSSNQSHVHSMVNGFGAMQVSQPYTYRPDQDDQSSESQLAVDTVSASQSNSQDTHKNTFGQNQSLGQGQLSASGQSFGQNQSNTPMDSAGHTQSYGEYNIYGQNPMYGEGQGFHQDQPYGQNQSYGEHQFSVSSQSFNEDQSFGQNQPCSDEQPYEHAQSFHPSQFDGQAQFHQSYDQNQSYGEDQPSGHSQTFGQNQPYGHNQTFGQNQPHGQTFSQDQYDDQQQYYDQYQSSDPNQSNDQRQFSFPNGQDYSYGEKLSYAEDQSYSHDQSYAQNQPDGTLQTYGQDQSYNTSTATVSNLPFDQSQPQVSDSLLGDNVFPNQAESQRQTSFNQPTDGQSQLTAPNSTVEEQESFANNEAIGQSQFPEQNHSYGLGSSKSNDAFGNQPTFGQNQFQVSSRLPRTENNFGGKTYNNRAETGHFTRESPMKSERSQGGNRFGEPGHFARESPNSSGGFGSGRDRGSCPRPAQRVDYVPPALPENMDELFKTAVHKGINFDRFDDIPVEVTGNNPPSAIKSFDELQIPDTLKLNLGKAEFTKPTPVQKHGMPIIFSGRDVMACAQTGSGKTVAFLLPVMSGIVNNRLAESSYMSGEVTSPVALCIAPTRELVSQIHTEAAKFSSGTYLRSVVCYGGVSVQHQLNKLECGCHILIGTPGRLIDFVSRNKVSLRNIRYLILDEADRMLDMGFENDVRKIVCDFGMPEKSQRQTLMFSATFPNPIQKLAGEFLNDYLFLAVGSVGGSNLDIKQEVLDVQGNQKRSVLMEIIGQAGTDKTLVFVERKRNADFLASWLSQNEYPATSISGDRTQQEREGALRDFRNGRAPVLIATSVAARGLDIPDVKHVINYDLPQQIEEYVHRIGRTGRIGNQGRATAFFERGKDDKLARSLVKVLSDALQDVPNWLEEAAEHALGTNYGPSGGRFASRDTRQFDRSRPSGGHIASNAFSSPAQQTTNVSFTNPVSASSNKNGGDDEDDWD